MELTKGDIVMIYVDPITRKEEEGLAELSNCLREEDKDGHSVWTVRFIDGNSYYVRTVHKDDKREDPQ